MAVTNYVIDRQYILKAINSLNIKILTVQQLEKMGKSMPELETCSLVPFIGNHYSSQNLDDKTNWETFNRIFSIYCDDLVINATCKPILSRAEFALFWISVYYHYEAVAYPETVYKLLSVCLKEKILF